MLIRFTVENFRSINQEAVLSMLPGPVEQHREHIVEGRGDSSIDVLRLALLYGANASGKSNLVKAMDFARTFILEGVRPKKPIPVEPFQLDEERQTQPSRFEFEFEFVVHGQAYAYGFVIDRKRVHEEWLFEINTKSEHKLFERETNAELNTHIKFGEVLLQQYGDKQFLGYVAQSVRINELFITKAYDDAVKKVVPIVEWFESFKIVQPEPTTKEEISHIPSGNGFMKSLASFMASLNTGIEDVLLSPVSSNQVALSQKKLSEIYDQLDENYFVLFHDPGGIYYIVERTSEGHNQISLLSTAHSTSNGKIAKFDVKDESDGTRRLIDLFPLFYADNKVVVVDELERSLHPNLVKRILQWYLKYQISGQLIVTTHESTLLDLDLLRRDEIWFVEKNKKGHSSLYSLEEFRLRDDLDMRKGYLYGRFGAIPMLDHSLQLVQA